ncbi:MAG: MAPEG family protein [Candidatus Neomarinimicrobiota bacterium]
MPSISILYPVFCMVLLTLLVSLKLMTVNVRASKNRQVPVNYFALYKGQAPDNLIQARDHYKNLFELPVLFYVLCLIIYAGADVQFPDLVLAWAFVLSRAIHSFIRASSNRVSRRFMVFFTGYLILLIHWSFFSLRIIF